MPFTPDQKKEFEQIVRDIYAEEFNKNYYSGAPKIPPHIHNGIDNLPIPSTGGTATVPGGLTTQVQFNDAGAFNGNAGLVYTKGTLTLGINEITQANTANAINFYTTNNKGLNLFSLNAAVHTGDITIFTGNNSASGGTGKIRLNTGQTTTGSTGTGDIELIAGNHRGSGQAGGLLFQAGSATAGTSSPGDAEMYGGDSSVSASGGGWVYLAGGRANLGNNNGGSVYLAGNSGHGTGVAGNVLINNGDAADGGSVMAIGEVINVPTTGPGSGGILYVQAGALKYRGSGGTLTTIAVA